MNVEFYHAANLISDEVSGSTDHINMCCNFGLTTSIDDKFADYPDRLKDLLLGDSIEAKNFQSNIRQFNSAFSMASMGAHLDIPKGHGPYCYRIHGQMYHLAGPLHPEPGGRPSYGQIYILDTAQAIEERLGNPANSKCDPQLMAELTKLISTRNPYAKAYKMMAEVEEKENTDALKEGRVAEEVRLIFDISTTKDRRRYNVPVSNEVAVVFVGEDQDIPASRSLAIHPRGGGLTAIRDIDKICDPLSYPIFFPTGADGWHPELEKKQSSRKRDRITQKEYYSYLLMSKKGIFNPLHHGRALFQQFVVDCWVKVSLRILRKSRYYFISLQIEQNRLNYHRTHQLDLRSDSYHALQDYLASAGEGPPGRMIVLPSSFKGSPRAMIQDFNDAMAMISKYGKPDIFLTFTCNPSWKEITENLAPGQSASDRPDLIARVFKMKVSENI